MTHTGPLSHLRVLDFTQLLAGPMATQILGDLGADVIKVEKPGGEWMRFWGILASESHGEMDSFLAYNRNKRSVAVDLKDAGMRDRLLDLAKDVDVVVENFRPGVLERLGLGYDDFARVNPSIIYVSSSGFGQSGPYRDRPGQDLLVQAMSGALQLTGRREDPPTACGIGISDHYTGLHIVVAVLATGRRPARGSASRSTCSPARSPRSSRSSRCGSTTARRCRGPRRTSGTSARPRRSASTPPPTGTSRSR